MHASMIRIEVSASSLLKQLYLAAAKKINRRIHAQNSVIPTELLGLTGIPTSFSV